ncbi:MAG: penicillin-binding transpeptidase domain-containing protein [Porphyromonas sp.]|nr:penicillin-binding protein 2 [Bacteroidales bacterium]MDD7558872.1 penicillin-binding transpeptidase domain-containing protein [Bacteroidales bacterium]MDY3101359.1 penicillin-binding transpeptidase domain-containing protein [Porphyromonas sp.]
MRLSNRFSPRRYVLGGAMILVVLIYLVRLFYIQVISDDYKSAAADIAFLRKTLYPSRGLIYDEKGRLVVYNRSTADIQVIMREVKNLDTLAFCALLGISSDELRERLEEVKDKKKNRGYSPYTPQLLFTQLSPEQAGLLEEKLYKFPGFYIRRNTARDYLHSAAALILGNVGEVNRAQIDADPYYVPSDYAGTTGIEKSYERFLRGQKGTSVLLRDAHGRIQGKYEQGKLDEELTSGHDLTLSIDIALQEYGEKLMRGKRGAIVMIEPETGEIRAMITAPAYDPKLLVGKDRGDNYKMLASDPAKPLFNRATMGVYPPGSTFKPVQSLVFLQEGAITPSTAYTCHHGYPLLRGKPACHGHPSPLDLTHALATSCNAYFCWGLHELLDNRARYPDVRTAFEHWKDHVVDMGFGYRTGVDLPSENRGYIPNSKVYDKVYHGRWNSSTIISISIGQGEVLATPLQIANFGALLANRGYYYTPHLVKSISGLPSDSLYVERHESGISRGYFDPVVTGMRMAVTGGTCRKANLPDFEVCGKTGTAENPHGKDHSLFLGFAPKDDPKIAIALVVENAGFGATYAVPIGRLMLDFYLHDGKISDSSKHYETEMMNAVIRE